MLKNILTAFVLMVSGAMILNAQSTEAAETTVPATTKKIYHTKSVDSSPPSIDGVLDDPIWESVEWGGDFIQRQPFEGKAPTEQTASKVCESKNVAKFFATATPLARKKLHKVLSNMFNRLQLNLSRILKTH